jgi:type IV secretory pathway VirB6-like protein
MTRAVVVIAILAAFCTIMIFITIRMIFKLKGYKEDDLD